MAAKKAAAKPKQRLTRPETIVTLKQKGNDWYISKIKGSNLAGLKVGDKFPLAELEGNLGPSKK